MLSSSSLLVLSTRGRFGWPRRPRPIRQGIGEPQDRHAARSLAALRSLREHREVRFCLRDRSGEGGRFIRRSCKPPRSCRPLWHDQVCVEQRRRGCGRHAERVPHYPGLRCHLLVDHAVRVCTWPSPAPRHTGPVCRRTQPVADDLACGRAREGHRAIAQAQLPRQPHIRRLSGSCPIVRAWYRRDARLVRSVLGVVAARELADGPTSRTRAEASLASHYMRVSAPFPYGATSTFWQRTKADGNRAQSHAQHSFVRQTIEQGHRAA